MSGRMQGKRKYKGIKGLETGLWAIRQNDTSSVSTRRLLWRVIWLRTPTIAQDANEGIPGRLVRENAAAGILSVFYRVI